MPDPPVAAAAFRSNLPSRRALPFVGRSRELDELAGMIASYHVVVVSGQPGVGKSELALELARVQGDRYAGGTFRIDATGAGALVDLARVAVNHLGVQFPDDLAIEDQCEQALIGLAATPALLIYDNVQSFAAIERWLPAPRMPCRVVITSVGEPRGPGWPMLVLDPLSSELSVELVEALAGFEVAEAYGPQLASNSGGLPVELCPAAAVLAYERRRGRTRAIAPGAMATETRASFAFVYEHLDAPPRLLLHATAALDPRRIDREELEQQLKSALGWTELDFRGVLEVCIDFHLLQGDARLTMHQLFSSFLREAAPPNAIAEDLALVRTTQRDRLLRVASELIETPANAALAASLLAFALAPEIWQQDGNRLSVSDATRIGRALTQIGDFEQARGWYQQAVEEARQGDIHGRVDHESLGASLHQVGFCYSSVGDFEQARGWYQQAVEEKRQGDIHGRVDHDDRENRRIRLRHTPWGAKPWRSPDRLRDAELETPAGVSKPVAARSKQRSPATGRCPRLLRRSSAMSSPRHKSRPAETTAADSASPPGRGALVAPDVGCHGKAQSRSPGRKRLRAASAAPAGSTCVRLTSRRPISPVSCRT